MFNARIIVKVTRLFKDSHIPDIFQKLITILFLNRSNYKKINK